MSFEINDNIKFNLITRLKLSDPPLIAILVGIRDCTIKELLLSCVLYSGFCSSCKIKKYGHLILRVYSLAILNYSHETVFAEIGTSCGVIVL